MNELTTVQKADALREFMRYWTTVYHDCPTCDGQNIFLAGYLAALQREENLKKKLTGKQEKV